jgi:glyoxylase-like metal-dependent hydrolase (beta-lactamase superfamily II)
MRRLAAYLLTTCALLVILQQREVATQVNTVTELAPGVYFHEGDIKGKGHCNNGWIVFDDYVLVVDANFPSGAREIIPKIQAQTNKPIRFAFDTHHHGDHAYANQLWADSGAVPVAHENVVEEMRKYETGLFGTKPGRWEDAAKNREDLRSTRLKAPTLLYRDVMIFDDGKHRVELRYFGVGHTHGDGFAWLPKEKILFTGDAAVNGPWNYLADGDSGAWIDTLSKAQALGATTVAPGHGPVGAGNVLEAQKQYFVALRAEVEKRRSLPPARVQADVRAIRDALLPRHGTYIDANATSLAGFEAHVAAVYKEMTGQDFPKSGALDAARLAHDRHHGLAPAQ